MKKVQGLSEKKKKSETPKPKPHTPRLRCGDYPRERRVEEEVEEGGGGGTNGNVLKIPVARWLKNG